MSQTMHPVHSMFGSRQGFSGSADRMALFPFSHSIISKVAADGHLRTTALSSVILTSAGLSCYYFPPKSLTVYSARAVILVIRPPVRSNGGTYKMLVMFSFDSAPARSLLFFVVDSVCMLVCLFVTLFQIDSSSLFLDGIQPFLGHQFTMTKATKSCSSNFDLLPWQRNLGYFFQKFQIASSFLFSDGIEPFFGS